MEVTRRIAETAERLAAALEAGDDPDGQRIAARLRASVLRPLAQIASAADQPPSDAGEDGNQRGLDDALLSLASAATSLLVEDPDGPELAEAAAALQDLALGVADGADPRFADLAGLMSGLGTRIQVAPNGPLLVRNPSRLTDWLGQPLLLRPQMALCRCGASAMKPLCDGSHARIGFTDAKDPNRVPDRRDTYVGQQVSVLDNRGTCQHSGFCTDRLPSAFHVGEEPFATPSGGRMDEVVRVVRYCPSGALSYAVDGVEARDAVDYHGTRPPAIEVSKDGPYRVTGAIHLVDSRGVDVARNEGASHEHFALCRCGHAQNKPFCTGMHWYIDFRDPVPPPGHEPTVFEWAGGLPALLRVTRLFYEKHVPDDPLLGPVFAGMAPDHPERVASWLAEVFGGPTRYSEAFGGYPRMLSQHRGRQLTEDQRERWVQLLLVSAREAGLPNDAEFRSALEAYIEWGSRLAVENSQAGASPPEHMPMPHWDWNTAAGPPGSRPSALAPEPEEDKPMANQPAEGEAVGFDAHIKPLFRQSDQRSMHFRFDLWSYDDVSAYADAILDRLRDGTMPCDGAWPPEQVELFERWTEGGKAP